MSGIISDNVGRSSGLLKAAGGGGKIGQVVQTLKTDTFSTTSTSPTAVTGLSVDITPVATSSKVLILVNFGSFNSRYGSNYIYATISGGNAATYIGDATTGHEVAVGTLSPGADNYSQSSGSMMYLDSPSTTSEVTYQVNIWGPAYTMIINRPQTTRTTSWNAASTIVAMEVLA